MEKLTRLQVSGFRSFRSIDTPLRALTVLIGANGSGKSNFVGLFNMLSFMLSGSLQTYIARKGGGSSVLHYGPKITPVLNADLTFEGEAGVSTYGFSLAFASPDRLIFTDERVSFLRNGEQTPYRDTQGSGHAETRLTELAASTKETNARTVARVFQKRLQEVQVYHFHDTSETAYIRTLQDVQRDRYLLSTGGNLASFLYMLRQAYPAHYARILATVRLVVPYLHDFVLEPSRLNQGRIELRWRDRNPDYEFGPHQLSDGSLRAIALITALMQPDELMPSVIVIDEPELGLHPAAVATVAQLVQAASAKRQVIVATQSPKFVSAFAPEDVVVMERGEDERGFGQSTLKNLSREDLGEWIDQYDLGQLYDMNVTGGAPQ
jgi:predicted ATPase